MAEEKSRDKKLAGFPHLIWKERYAHSGEETWGTTAARVANFVASAEENGERDIWSTKFYDIINALDFVPGGRILANSGRPQAQLLNCFVIPIKDSREAIGQSVKDYLIISGTGGGVGLSFRDIRYRGAAIVKSGGTSSGAVSFMDVIDAVADTIKIGGGRRAATMLSLPIDHPDLMEFLHHKLDLEKLNNANISVEITEKFVDAVKRSTSWDLMWAGKVIETVKARDVWNLIVKNSVKSGEPGMLNFELFEKMSNSYYYQKLSCTNPCGEIGLPEYGVCCLGSVNVNNFIKDGKFDESRFKKVSRVAVRFLDNILSVNTYPLPETRDVATNERRIGLGIMGIHSAMLQLGIKYSSRRGLAFIEQVYEALRNASYEASTDIAEEKGSFPKFEAEAFLESGFIKTLPSYIRNRIYKKGMRNVCVNTQAPTGTTSILCNVSSGIEPIFAPIYKRTFFSEESKSGRKTEVLIDNEVVKAIRSGKALKDLTHFEGAYDIAVRRHFQAQEAAQRYIDNSVSKTLNLPADFTPEQLSKIMLEFANCLKGTTIYRQGSRENEPLQPLEFNEKNLAKALKDHQEDANIDAAEDKIEEQVAIECPSGVCAV